MRKFVSFLGLVLLFAAACGASESDIRNEIAKASTCSAPSDCIDAGSYCPYGCNILVNKSEVDHIRALLQANSNNTCLYDCAQLLSIACENQHCVGKYQ